MAHIIGQGRGRLVELYGLVDNEIYEYTQGGKGISCHKGCCKDVSNEKDSEVQSIEGPGCCHLFTPTTTLEARRLVKYANDEGVPLDLVRARIQADLTELPGMTKEKFHKSAGPCMFLDTKTAECTVYPARPLACRLRLVTSDPRRCGDPDATVIKVDVDHIAKTAYPMLRKEHHKSMAREAHVGHLSAMVLHVLGVRKIKAKNVARPSTR